jgi:hypothetical protein
MTMARVRKRMLMFHPSKSEERMNRVNHSELGINYFR